MEIMICTVMLAFSVLLFLLSVVLVERNYNKMESLWQINARTLQKVNQLIDVLKSDNDYQE